MQHASLTPERWARFSFDQQILMIANEMNRAGKLMAPDDRERHRNAYARALELVDLTVMVQSKSSRRRELLRWRDLVAALFLTPSPEGHRKAARCLLQFTPMAFQQISFLNL